jgi:RNA polymerase sigma factor (sigma-70 family)
VSERLSHQPAGAEDRLFRRFLTGEATAVGRVESLVARVVRFRGYYIPAGERADLVQQVMLAIWRTVTEAGFTFTRNFDALIRSIAYRTCVDWVRRHRPTDPIDEATSDPAGRPDQEVLEQEQAELGRRVVEGLREPCRELFRLFAGEGMTYRQIGERLGRSEGALKTQMWQCLKEARAILGHLRAGRPGAGDRQRSPG